MGAPVLWVTPDDSSITIVDPATGLVTGVKPDTQGRVQAVLGTLTTRLLHADHPREGRHDRRFLLTRSSRCSIDNDSSLPLLPVLESFNPAGPVTGQRLVFTIVKPVFADTTGVQNVALTNGRLVDTVLTAADGTPVIGIVVSRVTGRTAPGRC